jgi:FkbM family methyltransferase
LERFVATQQHLFLAQLEKGQVVIDLGSCSGLTTIAFAKAVGATGKVIALEPDPMRFWECRNNVAEHEARTTWYSVKKTSVNNVVAINAAVSDRQGKKAFSDEGEIVQVDCLTLDDIVKAQGLSKVDFVKMNIGGREEAVLSASEDFFRKFKPKIIVESHVVAGVLSARGIASILRKYGYDCSMETPVPEKATGAWDTATGRYDASPVSKTPPWILGISFRKEKSKFDAALE